MKMYTLELYMILHLCTNLIFLNVIYYNSKTNITQLFLLISDSLTGKMSILPPTHEFYI